MTTFKIEVPGNYLTRGGETVKILQINSEKAPIWYRNYCLGEKIAGQFKGCRFIWQKSGEMHEGRKSDNDIVKYLSN
jgi:hypothetical protein